MSKQRVTSHNGRFHKKLIGKDWVNIPFPSWHADRDFDVSRSDHIDPGKTKDNVLGTAPGMKDFEIVNGEVRRLSFDTIEHNFYVQHFQAALDAKNERYRKNRHRDRCQTIDEYRRSATGCPEQTLYYIGSKADGYPDYNVLLDVYKEFLQWETEAFPQRVVLDWALHQDEDGAPHVEEHSVWIGHDRDGNEVVGQGKALEEMGIQAPDPGKKTGKYNNAKMTFTRMQREKMIELCQKRGLDIERTPREMSRSGKELLEWQIVQDQKKIQELTESLAKVEASQKKIQEIDSRSVAVRQGILAREDYVRLPSEDYRSLLGAAQNFSILETQKEDLDRRETVLREKEKLVKKKQEEAEHVLQVQSKFIAPERHILLMEEAEKKIRSEYRGFLSPDEVLRREKEAQLKNAGRLTWEESSAIRHELNLLQQKAQKMEFDLSAWDALMKVLPEEDAWRILSNLEDFKKYYDKTSHSFPDYGKRCWPLEEEQRRQERNLSYIR